MNLTLFDLDHTLLSGDSDVLWCEFLMERGLLDRAEFGARNAEMERSYQAGTVDTQAFANFYVSTLAGRTAAQWEPLRQEFLAQWIVPRIPTSAIDLANRHLDANDLVVMTTATNRFITELTALYFNIEHLLATEVERQGDTFSGRTQGTLNMREGKVERLQQWLAARGHRMKELVSTAYSDSINDLPLLELVQHPVVVDPDPRLAQVAQQRGWRILQLQR
jgi:HAD superfamily hydrolase (TIGR01490 family)